MRRVGDRVLAQWPVEVIWWYPAVVYLVERTRAAVQFDDGDRAWVTADQMRPLTIDVGSRVFGRWQGGRFYFPGEVTSKRGDAIYVAYDDGDAEWTTVGMIRVHQDDLPMTVYSAE